jgi:alkanesulfonate monooxygenase SsuD/methylene tetrahydromethanopterin reductase-like flavin-dependent oxidoreductase (luciferase family)
MIGIASSEQRDALEVDTAVLMHLLTSVEPISIETPRYKFAETRLQMDSYSNPHLGVETAAIVSPSGPRLAGRHEHGIDAGCGYLQHTASTPQMQVGGTTAKERIEWVVESGTGVIGTNKDSIEQIERLWDQSNGGFGALLLFDHN